MPYQIHKTRVATLVAHEISVPALEEALLHWSTRDWRMSIRTAIRILSGYCEKCGELNSLHTMFGRVVEPRLWHRHINGVPSDGDHEDAAFEIEHDGWV